MTTDKLSYSFSKLQLSRTSPLAIFIKNFIKKIQNLGLYDQDNDLLSSIVKITFSLENALKNANDSGLFVQKFITLNSFYRTGIADTRYWLNWATCERVTPLCAIMQQICKCNSNRNLPNKKYLVEYWFKILILFLEHGCNPSFKLFSQLFFII